mgnify:CR=1 FL=1
MAVSLPWVDDALEAVGLGRCQVGKRTRRLAWTPDLLGRRTRRGKGPWERGGKQKVSSGPACCTTEPGWAHGLGAQACLAAKVVSCYTAAKACPEVTARPHAGPAIPLCGPVLDVGCNGGGKGIMACLHAH